MACCSADSPGSRVPLARVSASGLSERGAARPIPGARIYTTKRPGPTISGTSPRPGEIDLLQMRIGSRRTLKCSDSLRLGRTRKELRRWTAPSSSSLATTGRCRRRGSPADAARCQAPEERGRSRTRGSRKGCRVKSKGTEELGLTFLSPDPGQSPSSRSSWWPPSLYSEDTRGGQAVRI